MEIPIYHIDAFTQQLFSGNPASVCILPKWLPDSILTAIAKENYLPATTFLVREHDQFGVRWITPEYELDICGHGTLAAGYVIFQFLEPKWEQVNLQSPRELFPVFRSGDFISLNFPTKNLEPCDSLQVLEKGLGCTPKELFQHKKERILVVLGSEQEVRELQPNMQILKELEHRGIIVTAPGNDVDFVSRTFYPKKSASEDAATGSSHCLLVPYWTKRLNKRKFNTRQLSPRGGEMLCEFQDDRVLISGKAIMYMRGSIKV